MSKANGAIEKKDTFLQHVSLKNYKSIKDVEIDFKPGLNIIIGKNGVGKTNFIDGLDAVLKSDFRKFIDSKSYISAWFKNDKIEVRISEQVHVEDDLLNESYFSISPNPHISLKINGVEDDFNKYHDVFFATLSKRGYIFKEALIKYGTIYNESTQFISLPLSFVLFNNGKFSFEWTKFVYDNETRFIYSFFAKLSDDVIRVHFNESLESKFHLDLKNNIISFSEEYFIGINEKLFANSPIKRIRLNPDFKIIDENQKQTIANFYLEFLIEENWFPFNLLSDGTKRLFCIISETLSMIYPDSVLIDNKQLKIILFEEPELGIHPHQLHQLMQFIKEQSREKQIIITTHSPQVLDVLGPDELDRVIICHSDPKNGTQLSHLTEKEINKAKKYMKEEAFLSDYWRFSDLEPAS